MKLSLLLILVCVPLFSEDLSREVHNTQAGTILPTGWYMVSSTKGGFTVETPTACTDFTVTDSQSDLRVYSIGARAETGGQYAVTKTVGRQGKALDDIAHGVVLKDPNGTKTTEKMKVLGVEGIHIKITDGARYGNMLIAEVAESIYTIVVEGPTIESKGIDETFDHLAETLRVR
jgi:hypothetical protein